MSALRLLGFALAVLILAGCRSPTRPIAPPPIETIDRESSAPAAPTPPEKPTRPPKRKKPTPAVSPTAAELTGGSVFARIVARLADTPCVEDRVVQRWERIYSRWPSRFASNLERVLPLLALVVDEVEAHALPAEFALLPIVESWYRPDAGSPRTAYGLWQFTTSTARNQGLRIGPGFDERLAPLAATRSAVRYLAMLQNRFGDWRLADMAFNAGEYRLARALAKAPASSASAKGHLPPGLAMTTYEHLAKMQALACLIAQPQRFKLALPRNTRIEPLQITALPADIGTLEAAALRAGIESAALRALNPVFLLGRLVAGAPRELLLPRTAAQRLAAAGSMTIASTPAASTPAASPPPATPLQYVVRRGDTLGAIAQRYRISLPELVQWNGLDVRALLHPGQVLRLEP